MYKCITQYKYINIRSDIIFLWNISYSTHGKKTEEFKHFKYTSIDFGYLDEFVVFKKYCNSFVSKITVTSR